MYIGNGVMLNDKLMQPGDKEVEPQAVRIQYIFIPNILAGTAVFDTSGLGQKCFLKKKKLVND